MLTAELVRVRRAGNELRLLSMNKGMEERAFQLASAYIEAAKSCVGKTRSQFKERCIQIPTSNSERKLADGLRKLVEDRCVFAVSCPVDPKTLRSEIFLAASHTMRNLKEGERFDRSAFLNLQAQIHDQDREELERSLYSDLRSQHLLLEFEQISVKQLVSNYQMAQGQAVLLRAVSVSAEVLCRDPYAYRALFRKIKFLRLLHVITPLPDGGYQIKIDGPYSLFSSATKYGLQLALSLPVIQACDDWKIEAQLRWGKDRNPLVFRLKGKSSSRSDSQDQRLPDEVENLLSRFSTLKSQWLAIPSSEILQLPGVGLCIPDLRFENRITGEIAYLEVMGYWSRDAVWKRIELVQQGLPYRILFAVSSRLRVSESVLDDSSVGELYVYKSALSAKEIIKRLDRK